MQFRWFHLVGANNHSPLPPPATAFAESNHLKRNATGRVAKFPLIPSLQPSSRHCSGHPGVATVVSALQPSFRRCSGHSVVATVVPALQRASRRCNRHPGVAAVIRALQPSSRRCSRHPGIAAVVPALRPPSQRCNRHSGESRNPRAIAVQSCQPDDGSGFPLRGNPPRQFRENPNPPLRPPVCSLTRKVAVSRP